MGFSIVNKLILIFVLYIQLEKEKEKNEGKSGMSKGHLLECGYYVPKLLKAATIYSHQRA